MKDFFDDAIPKYAILSHRWGAEETSYQKYESTELNRRFIFAKIRGLCKLARSRGWRWAWIDTCCIDKKSSAELSEAINSMYRWYEGSAECYVHLSDVKWNGRDIDRSLSDFRQSVWFTRGWTLQELLAPEKVLFFDCHWKYIGDKTHLSEEVSAITGIHTEYLLHPRLDVESVATKMSWASKRVTSRVEDAAYCLMGLFDVNMPLLYGEGRKAFKRLQLEIIKTTKDESIFAWTDPDLQFSGILAYSPSQFAHLGKIRKLLTDKPPYSMTNKGLAIKVPPEMSFASCLELRLDCYDSGKWACSDGIVTTIWLIRDSLGHWRRFYCNKLGEASHQRVTDNDSTIYIL